MNAQHKLDECKRILGIKPSSELVGARPAKVARWLREHTLKPGQRLRVWVGRGAEDFRDVQVMSDNLTECAACERQYRVRFFDEDSEPCELEIAGGAARLCGERVHKLSLQQSRRTHGIVERRQFGRGSWYLSSVNVTGKEVELTFHINLLMGQDTPSGLAQRCESLKKGIQETSAQLYKDLSDIAQLPNTKADGTGSYRYDGPNKDSNGLTWLVAWMYRGEAKDVKARLKDLQWLVK
jgi:hypothetical protein